MCLNITFQRDVPTGRDEGLRLGPWSTSAVTVTVVTTEGRVGSSPRGRLCSQHLTYFYLLKPHTPALKSVLSGPHPRRAEGGTEVHSPARCH